jgi:hypothetical protein
MAFETCLPVDMSRFRAPYYGTIFPAEPFPNGLRPGCHGMQEISGQNIDCLTERKKRNEIASGHLTTIYPQQAKGIPLPHSKDLSISAESARHL